MVQNSKTRFNIDYDKKSGLLRFSTIKGIMRDSEFITVANKGTTR